MFIVIDGADAAIKGYTECGSVCYEYNALVQVFIDQGMDSDGAVEWIDFNILGGGVPNIVILYEADREEIDALADAYLDDEEEE
jgi:hypothetical protein